MGATSKQRKIYIKKCIDIKAAKKNHQTVRTTYGRKFYHKYQSSSISLDVIVHDIKKNTEICKIWDSVNLNVIVLPYNHKNDLYYFICNLIRELPHTNVPLKTKTLLICPSNFSSMTEHQYINETNKVRRELLQLIHLELGDIDSTQILNLHTYDIIMMPSAPHRSLLPTGKDWRVNAAQYTLKHLLSNDKDIQTYMTWILTVQDIRFITNNKSDEKTQSNNNNSTIKYVDFLTYFYDRDFEYDKYKIMRFNMKNKLTNRFQGMSAIQKIDSVLKIYYTTLNRIYNDNFVTYCDDNSIDDDILHDELDGLAEDNILIDFDDNFPMKNPLSNDEAKQQFMHNFLRHCLDDAEYILTHDAYRKESLTLIPEFNAEFFDVK
eukprot:279582_1